MVCRDERKLCAEVQGRSQQPTFTSPSPQVVIWELVSDVAKKPAWECRECYLHLPLGSCSAAEMGTATAATSRALVRCILVYTSCNSTMETSPRARVAEEMGLR